MKKLELTRIQKTRLLEMSKNLFSEYKYHELYIDGILSIYNIDNKVINIHWYEFTVRILSQKLFEILAYDKNLKMVSPVCLSNIQANFGKALIMLNLNPIDYLYERFINMEKWA